MASRWMQSMKARDRGFRRRQGNISLTENEKKHLRPKFGETQWNHLLRMLQEATAERSQAREWWRRTARIIQVIDGPFDANEWNMIRDSAHQNKTVAECESIITHYRKLTNRTNKKIRELERDEEYAALALM